MSLLFHRMFFYRLNEKLSALNCYDTFRLSNQILTQMNFNRGQMNGILEVFKKNGAVCDCEVIYYVLWNEIQILPSFLLHVYRIVRLL